MAAKPLREQRLGLRVGGTLALMPSTLCLASVDETEAIWIGRETGMLIAGPLAPRHNGPHVRCYAHPLTN